VNAIAYGAEDLPPIVQRALSRVLHPDYFVDLSATERFAFSQLVRRVDVTDVGGLVWCKRVNFAKLLGVSEATVYRILAKLESAGFITRDSQTRSRTGALSVAALRMTAATIELLGFKQGDETLYSYPQRSPSAQASRLATVQDLNQTTKKQSASQKQSSECSSKVPSELGEMIAKGLSPSQVFKLMAIARERTQRLGDVWLLVRAKVATLRARALFAFLRATLKLDRDWAYLASRTREQLSQAESDSKQRALTIRLQNDMAGRRVAWRNLWIEICPTGSGHLTVSRQQPGEAIAVAPPSSELAVAFWSEQRSEYERQRC